MRSELGTLLATYAIKLQDGFLQSSRIISSSSDLETSEVVWYAYAEPLPDSGFFGDQTYTDLLSKEMTSRFIEITHEVYKEHVGSSFGSVVPSIFTDEPQYCPMSTLNAAEKLQDIFLPWTRGIIDSFKASKGGDLLELLPRLVWDPADGQPNATRSQFLDHVCELFSTNYIGTIAKWCAKNNIMCIGHMNAVSILYIYGVSKLIQTLRNPPWHPKQLRMAKSCVVIAKCSSRELTCSATNTNSTPQSKPLASLASTVGQG